jgi:heterodisulfide reductase subunit C2
MAEAPTQARAPTLFDRIVAATPGICHLGTCIQCGTCGGSCPSGADMEHTPRALFAMIKAEMKEQVLRSNTPWYCVSCYYCMVRCPQSVHITDIMYTIKRMSIQEGLYRQSTASDAPGFSQDFIFFVENFGRSFELGIAAIYNLRYHPLDMPKMVPMGLGMMRKQRMDLTPKRIKDVTGLKAILAKAKELEGEI